MSQKAVEQLKQMRAREGVALVEGFENALRYYKGTSGTDSRACAESDRGLS